MRAWHSTVYVGAKSELGKELPVGSRLVMDVANTIHELEEVVTCKSHRKSPPTLQEREEVCTRARKRRGLYMKEKRSVQGIVGYSMWGHGRDETKNFGEDKECPRHDCASPLHAGVGH